MAIRFKLNHQTLVALNHQDLAGVMGAESGTCGCVTCINKTAATTTTDTNSGACESKNGNCTTWCETDCGGCDCC